MKIGSLEKTIEEETSHKKGIKKKVIFRKNQIPHITQFAQTRIPKGEIIENHEHPDMYEIFLVEKGTGKVRVNNVDYLLKRGSYFVIEPGESHKISSDSELTLTYFGVEVRKHS